MHRRRHLVLHTLHPLSNCLKDHEAVYRNVPGFTEQVAVFHRLAAAAALQTEHCLDGRPHLPQDLRDVRESLIQTICSVSGPLAGWAAVIGDESLRGQLVRTAAELRAMGPTLSDHARAIAAIGRCTLTQGAGHYGLTELALERLLRETREFETRVDACPDAFQTLHGAAEELHAFLRQVLDPLVSGFLLSAPHFCAAYRQARQARRPGLVGPAERIGEPSPATGAVLHA